ncbi:fibroblast growth factor receptor 2-like [Anopheles funestus]|uniref:Soluble interferon alpha/beta receptor OPG204 n=1 Tax=Anopheles funestus TaxID=62324 RepID=A0A4Y0BI38_ANOFN|nr:fibroblast growth factor receptor 2-like [Anopheles funestus]XP_049278133.1 fibroblast growth factor receptor 2-like [Anopheles funestus]
MMMSARKRSSFSGCATNSSACTFLLLMMCVFIIVVVTVSAENHCTENRYEHSLNTHHLQFTKEIPDQEYGVLKKFKSLHCCGKGYRSIEWFKNNQPHPWSNEVSSFIVYPEAANQTIYSRTLEKNDIGNYSCILRNETHAIKHEIELRLQDKLDNPMPTFRPKDLMVSVGESGRFYCEAFVGNLYLPDATNEIVWKKMFDDRPEMVEDSTQVNVTREEGQIIGSYLRIPNIQTKHYGRYRCQIVSGNSAQKLNLSVLLSPVEVTAITDTQLSMLVYVMATLLLVLVVLFAWICRTVQQRTNSKKDNRCSAQFIANNEHDNV